MLLCIFEFFNKVKRRKSYDRRLYFCKIINGDFGTEFVYETENTVVFNDINPKAPIHMLVCPKNILHH